MTKRVYITGDPADPIKVKVFDADTHKQLDDVAELELTMNASKKTVARFRRVASSATETVEVVKRPTHKLAGMYLRTFGVQMRHDTNMQAEIVEVISSEFTTDADGVLQHGVRADLIGKNSIPDVLAMTYRGNPEDLRVEAAQKSMHQIGDAIVADILPGRPPGGQIAFPKSIARKTIKDLLDVQNGIADSVNRTADCPECFGTGLKNGFGVACSKGCPIKGTP